MSFKIKFITDSNLERFMEIVEESYGNVVLRLHRDKFYDLKNDITALEILKEEISKKHVLNFYISNPKDYFKFVYFVMGAA